MFCKYCGYRLPENSLFCPSCGGKLDYDKNSSEKQNSYSNSLHFNNPNPQQSHQKVPAPPMGYFNFLTNFLFYATVILNIFVGCVCLLAAAFIPNLLALDSFNEFNNLDEDYIIILATIYGVYLLFYAMFAFYVRHRLIKFCSDGPYLFILLHIISGIAEIFLSSSFSESSSNFTTDSMSITANPLLQVFGIITFAVIHYIYFHNRKHLFVN